MQIQVVRTKQICMKERYWRNKSWQTKVNIQKILKLKLLMQL